MLLEMFFFFLLFFSFLHILKKRTVSLCLFAIRDVQKVANLLDLAKSFPKSIWLRTSVSKKPRTIFRETVDAVLPESLRDDVVVHEGNAGLPRHGARERRLAIFRQNVTRSRLYRHRFLQQNMRFAAFFKIFQIFKLKFLKFGNILQILRHLRNFC